MKKTKDARIEDLEAKNHEQSRLIAESKKLLLEWREVADGEGALDFTDLRPRTEKFLEEA